MPFLAVHSKLDYPFSVKKKKKEDILSPNFIRKNRLFCLKRQGVGGATRGNASTGVP